MEGNNFWKLSLPSTQLVRHERVPSNSSETSHASNASRTSHSSEEQFAFSPAVTPSKGNAPSRVMASGYAAGHAAVKDGLLFGKELNTHFQSEDILAPTDLASKPIDIEPVGGRKNDISSASASRPTEPLSARGDIVGGYFLLHEDPESRVRIPHPFHQDADMARKQSLQTASESSKASAEARSLGSVKLSEPSYFPFPSQPNVSATPDTPLSSYNPNGTHDSVALPLGKYYPSNWERRYGKARPPRPVQSAKPVPVAVQSEFQVSVYRGDQAHTRSGSEAQRRLQQYQRDMVAQAAMAASAILSKSASTSSSAASSPHGRVPLTIFKTHKPVSPRLKPLGSPGPVTPMSLEDGYMALGGPLSAAGSDRRVTEDRNLDTDLAGNGRQRRKDTHSLTVGMSALSV
ncbi:hypothetical protein MMYC01_207199 [Madurella mycetomatis]|uniref:Uncharacterized protein n=1 Tax=Madurella mycetomatis TaxID=100816 RepID=A0A175W0X5_9PEZI|nr:hypothetical protein MMYC01_207199 [Madurella mycetomatis]